MPKAPQFASAGSQRWLQIAVSRAPQLLDAAFRECGAIQSDESLGWCSPLELTQFIEYRDERALEMLGIAELPIKPLEEFWPRRGPVWDGLAVTDKGQFVFVEAKAHIPEVLSPPSQAGEASRRKILAALEEARRYYAPKSSKQWFEHFYQYCNRLAHHYFFAKVNGLPSRLVFLDFYNDRQMNGPSSPDEWKGATRLVHAFLGLPESLEDRGVFHAHTDAQAVASAA
jgi:hypothetical protein